MQAVETLEKLGYTLTCHADGSIGIRGRPSPEADAALSVLRGGQGGGGGMPAPAGHIQDGQEGLSHRVRFLRGALSADDDG